MTSREQILAKVKSSQPELTPLPAIWDKAPNPSDSPVEQFRNVLTTIGGAVIDVTSYEAIGAYILQEYKEKIRLVSTLPALSGLPELAEYLETDWENKDPHSYENIDLAIIGAHFGIAENAALWITEALMHQRVIPFICQQLAVVLKKSDILHTMHEAYARIGNDEYGFGAFIAGPSKTADIEQSLVLGAHGPKGMTVFLLD
ncbi:MAG: lactate utilization protein B/C [Pedobacter sp.]|nr:MAG: lactate utilization protein B/C [Pedobacter sp.]